MGDKSRSFGEALRVHRTELGLTQKELAHRARVSIRAVRYIESGRVTRPRPQSLRRLASSVGLDPGCFQETSVRSPHIRVLGPLVVERGGRPVDGIPLMQRCLLGLLALHPNQPVGRDEIIEVLWNGKPPHSHVHLVHNYVARIRRLCDVKLVNGGYRLNVGDEVDLVRFNALVRGPDVTFARLTEAVDLWRGPVLADLSWSLQRHPAAVALHQRHIAAVLAHTDLALRLGLVEHFSPALITLAHDEPLHEGLQARLMLAYARSGQQACALRLFQEVRERLAAELGIEPSAELRDVHLRVLRQEL